MRRSRAISLAIALAASAGCTKQGVVKSGLVDAGIASPVADCMSREMAKRLSVDELRKLARAGAPGTNLGQLTIADYVERARRVNDPKVVAVTGGAAAYCSVTN